MKEKQLLTYSDFENRDLWKEARDRSAKYGESFPVKVASALAYLIHPANPQNIHTFGSAESLYCVDLNKYRPDVNVEMLIDQGVRCFMLRVLGPTQWIYGNWKYEIDATFVPYYQRIRAYAKLKGVVVWVVGYGVHNPWSNEEGNYLGIDPQVTMLKEATRNHQCDMYAWDDEVAQCWKNGQTTTITANNLVKSVSICMEQTWQEMERSPLGPNYHKMPIHYSANWFMQRYAKVQYQTWLDNNNKNRDTRHFLTWRAWLPTVFTATYSLISQLFDKVISPTGIQENSYLRMGSELAADLWQCTFTAKGPWCGPQSSGGIDASISYGPSATIADFAYNANLKNSVTPDPDPDPIPDELREKIKAQVAIIGSAHQELKSLLGM